MSVSMRYGDYLQRRTLVFPKSILRFPLLEQLVAYFPDVAGDLEGGFGLLARVALRERVLIIWIVLVRVAVRVGCRSRKGGVRRIKLSTRYDSANGIRDVARRRGSVFNGAN